VQEAIKNIVEMRGIQSSDISAIMDDIEEEPIEANPQMATQLSEDMPPVGDPEYIPATQEELGRAAHVISIVVPQDQIEWYYRWLHKLLDKALDRGASDEIETGEEREVEAEPEAIEKEKQSIEESVRKIVENMIDKIQISEKSQKTLKEEDDWDDPEEWEDTAEWSEPTEEELKAIEAEESQETPEEEDASVARIGEVGPHDISALLIKLGYDKVYLPASENPGETDIATYPKIMWQSDPNDRNKGSFVLGKEQMRVLIRAGLARKQFIKAMKQSDNLRSMFLKYKSQLADKMGIDDPIAVTAQAWNNVEEDFGSRLGKEGNPITTELAAEMYANITADNISKAVQGNVEMYNKALESEIARLSDPVIVNFSGTRMPENKNIEVPLDMFVSFLRSSQPKDIFAEEEVEQFIDVTPDEQEETEKERKAREKSERQQAADELGISYGAYTNVEQDMAVALGLRMKGAKKRAPEIPDENKVVQYIKMYNAIYDKFRDMIAKEIILHRVAKSKDVSIENLSDKDLNAIDRASQEITDAIIDYDKNSLEFSKNSISKPVFDGFTKDFVKQMETDLDGPLFYTLPDYADFKYDREFEARDDFGDKDVRETKSTAKNLAYFVRNIFNVGYELEAMSNKMRGEANQARNNGDVKTARKLRQEADEYETEAAKYMYRSREILDAISETEILDKLVKKYTKQMTPIVDKAY